MTAHLELHASLRDYSWTPEPTGYPVPYLLGPTHRVMALVEVPRKYDSEAIMVCPSLSTLKQ